MYKNIRFLLTVGILLIFSISAKAGFLGGKEYKQTYYPYQIVAFMPITGMEVSPCNSSDNTITITFGAGYALSFHYGDSDKELELEYYGVCDDGSVMYKAPDFNARQEYLFVGDDIVCIRAIINNMTQNPINTYYTTTDQRGTTTPSYNNSGNDSYYNNSGSSSSGSSSSRRACISCSGSGKCKTCGGQGWYYTDPGSYTGNHYQKRTDCPVCRGTGNCGTCHGAGYIR